MTPVVRLAWVDVAKGIAILAVVYFHVTLFLGAVGVDDALGRVKLAFELFPMPAFFLLSGLLNRRAASWSFGELWRRRLLPILYLYVLWSLLRFAFYTALPFLETDAADAPPTNPITLVLLPVLPTSSYWFVYALALFTLVAWLIRKLPPLVQLGAAAILSTLVTSGWLNTHTVAWDRIGALFFFFLLGSLEWRRIRLAVARTPWWGTLLCGLVLVGQIAALYLVSGIARVPFFVLLGQLLAVFLGFQLSRAMARTRWFGWVAVVGQQSLAVYLIHLFLVAPIAALVGLLHPDWSRWIDIAVCVVVTAVVVLGCLGLARLAGRARWLFSPPRWMTGARRRLAAQSAAPAVAPGAAPAGIDTPPEGSPPEGPGSRPV